ncbi:unnamed protein product [Paramecium pentaurelia]|uniref:Uncharacterized protein n=1 Tax=Paramecium pentaurelia TaxID=43138 RepID=A0A8S1VMH0_9CILI|nr:unnamed protein product [Paramecium pentaurelia]
MKEEFSMTYKELSKVKQKFNICSVNLNSSDIFIFQTAYQSGHP